MTKRTLWYVCLGLLCCLALVFVVQAASQQAAKSSPANVSKSHGVTATTQSAPVPVVKSVETPQVADQSSVPAEELRARRAWENSQHGEQIAPADKELIARYGLDVVPQGPGNPLDAQGGPDAYGYRWVDNQAPDTVVYGWIELCSDPLATIGPSGDDATQLVNFGFSFLYYGTTYTSGYISTNGVLQFGTANSGWSNTCISSTNTNNAIYIHWDDMDYTTGTPGTCATDVIYWRSFGTYAVIEFHKDLVGYATGAEFEAILWPDGKVKIQWHATDNTNTGASATVAVEAAGANGLQYSCNTAFAPNGKAVVFYPGAVTPARCCYGDPLAPSCVDNLPADCAALGGTWTSGMTCAANPCQATTPGTNCAAPMNITGTGSWTGSTCGFVDDYNNTCLGLYDGGEDFIYRWTVSTAGSYTLALTSNSSYVGIAIDNTCPLDASCLGLATSYGSSATINNFAATPGTYYIMIDTWPSPTCIPSFTLTINTYVPAPCPDFTLTAPGTVSGDLTASGDDCALHAGNDQTIGVTIPTAGDWIFSLCPGSGWDTYLYLSSTCCGPYLTYNDDFCGLTSQITYTIPSPGTYYIDVEPYGAATGTWTLVVSQNLGRCCYGSNPAQCAVNSPTECAALSGNWTLGGDCVQPCPEPPANDNCANAVVVNQFPFSGTYSDLGATMECAAYAGPDVYFAIVLTQTCDVTISFCGSEVVQDWIRIVLDQGCPCSGVWTYATSYNWTDCGDGNATINFLGLPAGTYYYGKYVSSTQTGNYTISFTSPCVSCDPATGLTVYRAPAGGNAVNVRWNATQTLGHYRLFRTDQKNNDGDPNNGSDPQWTLATELAAPATPGVQSYTDTPLGAYYNYAVVHDCAPRGRCCYGDPQAPSCLSNTTEAACGALSGVFTAGADCSTPCPIVPVNDNCQWVTPVTLPATFTGTRDGATPDCADFSAYGEGNVWIAFTTTSACDVTLDYCGTTGGTIPGDGWLNFTGTCPCSAPYPQASTWNTTECADGNWTMHWSSLPAGTWYYPVMLEASSGSTGAYTIHVTCTPPPLGRCCYGDPTQCVVNTSPECTALAGIWTLGSDCSAPCPAVRACPSMTPTDGTLDPVPSTPWGGTISGNCGNFGKWDASFTAVAATVYHFDLCADAPGTGTANFDSDIKICDAAGTILTGADGLSSCSSYAWNVNDWTWTAPSAGTYYVVIAPYYSYDSHTCGGTSSNTFTLQYYRVP